MKESKVAVPEMKFVAEMIKPSCKQADDGKNIIWIVNMPWSKSANIFPSVEKAWKVFFWLDLFKPSPWKPTNIQWELSPKTRVLRLQIT